MDDIDRQLVIDLQKEIPLVRRPFEEIGRKLKVDSAELILRINRLCADGVIQQMGAIFNSEKLGYRSALAAMAFPEETLEQAARIIGEHPGVIFCVKASGEYNLWLILSLPASEHLEQHLAWLQELSGAREYRILEALKVFKPKAFKPSGEANADLTEFQIRLLRILQEDLSLTDEPYLKIAYSLGVTEDQVLSEIQMLIQKRIIRKIAALAFQKGAQKPQVLVAWQIPDEKLAVAAQVLADQSAIVTCVKRPAYAGFPYTLHTLLKADSCKAAEDWAAEMQKRIGAWPYAVFERQKDFKKTRIKYFSDDIKNWRSRHQSETAGSF